MSKHQFYIIWLLLLSILIDTRGYNWAIIMGAFIWIFAYFLVWLENKIDYFIEKSEKNKN